MKRQNIHILCSLLLLYNSSNLLAQVQENTILNDIISSINNYRNKTVTLRLKLKNLDNIFEKIVFYDRKNTDIAFDISELKKESQFQKQILNLHRGLDYIVTFTVKDLTQNNYVMGDLKSFQPAILYSLRL